MGDCVHFATTEAGINSSGFNGLPFIPLEFDPSNVAGLSIITMSEELTYGDFLEIYWRWKNWSVSLDMTYEATAPAVTVTTPASGYGRGPSGVCGPVGVRTFSAESASLSGAVSSGIDLYRTKYQVDILDEGGWVSSTTIKDRVPAPTERSVMVEQSPSASLSSEGISTSATHIAKDFKPNGDTYACYGYAGTYAYFATSFPPAYSFEYSARNQVGIRIMRKPGSEIDAATGLPKLCLVTDVSFSCSILAKIDGNSDADMTSPSFGGKSLKYSTEGIMSDGWGMSGTPELENLPLELHLSRGVVTGSMSVYKLAEVMDSYGAGACTAAFSSLKLTVKPKEYWPYKNSAGQPVWDKDTGEQIHPVS